MPGIGEIRRILILDDEPSVAETLALVFSTRGYEVQVAYSAEAGIEIISRWPPELAIVDVILPGMNGIDFSIILRENYPSCRILLFSGQPDSGAILEESLKKGHDFLVLAKPLHPSVLLSILEGTTPPSREPLNDA